MHGPLREVLATEGSTVFILEEATSAFVGLHAGSVYPGLIGILRCWFLWREENRGTRRKTLRARHGANNKLNPHVAPERNRAQATW